MCNDSYICKQGTYSIYVTLLKHPISPRGVVSTPPEPTNFTDHTQHLEVGRSIFTLAIHQNFWSETETVSVWSLFLNIL